MRISNSTQISNLVQLIQSEALTPELKALLGKSIEVKVLDVSTDAIKVDADGTLLNVVYKGADLLQKGDILHLKIDGFQGDVVVASRVPMNTTDKNVNAEILVKLGLEPNEENQNIVKALIAQSLPVTHENVKMMRLNMIQMKTFLNAWTDIDAKHPILSTSFHLMESSVKDLLKAMVALESKTQIGSSDFDIGKNPELKNPPETNVTMSLDGTVHVVEKVSAQAPDLGVIIQQHSSNENEAILRTLLQEVSASPKEGTLPLKEAVQELIKQFSSDYSAKFVKDSLVLNLKNIMLLFAQNAQVKTIGSGFVEISNAIKNIHLSEHVIDNMLEALAIEDSEIAMDRFLKIIQSEVETSDARGIIEKELTFIKEAIQLSPGLNDQVYYMPMPINLNHENQMVNLYMKSRKGKFDKDDFSLLVALNTVHYGEVRCFVQKKKVQFSLQFSFDSDEIKTTFENKKGLLTDALEKLEDLSFDVTFSVKKNDEMILRSDMMANQSISVLDLKV